MHYVYVLYSTSADGFYVGETADLHLRLSMHNDHLFKGAVTAKASDWSVLISFRTDNRQQAIIVEKYINGKKSHKYLTCRLLETNEISKKLALLGTFKLPL